LKFQGRAGCKETVTVIEAPCQSDLLIELIRTLKPKVVVTGMAQFEAITSATFLNILSVTKDVGSRLFLDLSEHLELSSLPSSNGVLKFLAGNYLPSHAAILCGLVKNQVTVTSPRHLTPSSGTVSELLHVPTYTSQKFIIFFICVGSILLVLKCSGIF
jgi:hypothetical protein